MINEIKKQLPYVTELSSRYPTIQATANEIIKLNAMWHLPKPTEHFISDVHGEYEAFKHIINNASGVIREKVDILFSTTLLEEDRARLASLIYYPDEKLEEFHATEPENSEWEIITINRLISVCRLVGSKYTRTKVRASMPEDYADIINELVYTDKCTTNKEKYYSKLLESVVSVGRADAFIIALTETIKRLVVDKLHLVGDIFDRGPRPDIIMDMLTEHHNVDIQWGNHDILWMGAAAGSRTCILNVLNNSITYHNLDVLEIGYGINLRPLAVYANEVYNNVDVSCFMPRENDYKTYSDKDKMQLARMHKAVAVMMFKLEGMIILRNPSFNMNDRLVLNLINYDEGTVEIEGRTTSLKDKNFPTIDPKDPYKLSAEEAYVLRGLSRSFSSSEKLQKHIRFLYTNGGLYKCENGNLLFHGCMPTDENGEFTEFEVEGTRLKCREYLDHVESKARQGYYALPHTVERQQGKDFLWFLWCGRNSPLFGRQKITTFERLLIDDKSFWKEDMNPYYTFNRNEDYIIKLLAQFGLEGKHTHVINGHVPVKVSSGEAPVHANGRLIVIDGGFSRPYHVKTGIAGYTLIFNSYGLRLIAHEPFKGTADAIANNTDIMHASMVYEAVSKRIYVGETDMGLELTERINGLTMLLKAYRDGIIKEKSSSSQLL